MDPAYADAIYNLAALEYEANNMSAATDLWRRFLDIDGQSAWTTRAKPGLAIIDQNAKLTG